MSSDNVEVLREGLALINSGDIERIVDFMHPDFVVTVPRELSAEPDTYRGHEGIRRYFESFQEAMDDIRFEPERFWDEGEYVLVQVRVTARGRQTAIPVEQRVVIAWRIAEGRAIEALAFPSLEAARASLREAPAA